MRCGTQWIGGINVDFDKDLQDNLKILKATRGVKKDLIDKLNTVEKDIISIEAVIAYISSKVAKANEQNTKDS